MQGFIRNSQVSNIPFEMLNNLYPEGPIQRDNGVYSAVSKQLCARNVRKSALYPKDKHSEMEIIYSLRKTKYHLVQDNILGMLSMTVGTDVICLKASLPNRCSRIRRCP